MNARENKRAKRAVVFRENSNRRSTFALTFADAVSILSAVFPAHVSRGARGT
jgi:hypothetical protein